jgi:hypothetical protein
MRVLNESFNFKIGLIQFDVFLENTFEKRELDKKRKIFSKKTWTKMVIKIIL